MSISLWTRFAKCVLTFTFIVVSSVAHADAEQSYQKALRYLQENNPSAAQIELKNALKEQPSMAKARLELGKIHLDENQYLAAEKELVRVSESELPPETWVLPLSRTYLLLTKFDQLESIPAPNLADLKPQWAAYQVLAKVANGKLDESVDLIDLANQAPDTSALKAYVTGAVASERGDLALALSSGTRAVKLDPRKWEYWFFLAGVQQKQKDLPSAIESLEKALELSPTNARLHFGKIHLLMLTGKTEQAEKDVDALLASTRVHPMANYYKGIFYASRGEYRQAKEYYQKVLAVIPDHVPTFYALGNAYFRLNEFFQAEDFLTRYSKEYPENLDAAKALAITKLKLNNIDGAIEVLQEMESSASDNPSFLALYGSLLVRGGDVEKGEALLKKAVTLAPDVSAIKTQLAIAQLATGKRQDAIESLSDVQTTDESVLQTKTLLVYAHLKNKEFEQAIQTAQALVDSDPKKPEYLNVLGAAYMAIENKDKAKQSYMSTLAIDADNLPALMSLAMIENSEKAYDQAAKRLDRIIKLRPSHLRALVLRAQILDRQGNRAGAVKLLEQAVAENPKALGAGIVLIREYLNDGLLDQATSLARSLHQTYPKNPTVLGAYSAVLVQRKDYAQAQRVMEQWIDISPDSPVPEHRLALMLLQKNDVQGAETHAKKSLSKDEKYGPALVTLVSTSLKKNQYDEALSYVKTLRQFFPDAPNLDRWSGQIYAAKGDVKTAETYFKSAIEHNDGGAVRSAYAKLLMANKRYPDAIDVLKSWLKKSPDDFRIASDLAVAQQTVGNNQEALKLYEQVLANNPKDVLALNNAAWLLALKGDPKAIDYARKALDIAPKSSAVMDTLGWALHKNNKSADAVIVLKEARLKSNGAPDISYHLAASLVAAGNQAEARRILDEILKGGVAFENREAATALRKTL